MVTLKNEDQGFASSNHIGAFFYFFFFVKQYKSDPRYRIDQLFKEAGHTVLRLPPYHCDLNPIELIWSQLKRYVAANNVTFNYQMFNSLLKGHLRPLLPNDGGPCVSM